MPSPERVQFFKERDVKMRQLKALHGIKCWLCEEMYPKRTATTLLPGQTCKVCGYKDTRPRV